MRISILKRKLESDLKFLSTFFSLSLSTLMLALVHRLAYAYTPIRASKKMCRARVLSLVRYFLFLLLSTVFSLSSNLSALSVIVGRLWLFATLTITFLVRNSSSIKRQTEVEDVECEEKAHRCHGQIDFFSVTFFCTHSFTHCVCLCLCECECVWNILLLYIYDEKRCSYFVY